MTQDTPFIPRLRTGSALAAGVGLLLATVAFHSALAGSLSLQQIPPRAARSGGSDQATANGGPGTASQANRAIGIEIGDAGFDRKDLHVLPGETVRVVVANVGKSVHEFDIVGPEEHGARRAEMAEKSGMAHQGPKVVTVRPGERANSKRSGMRFDDGWRR